MPDQCHWVGIVWGGRRGVVVGATKSWSLEAGGARSAFGATRVRKGAPMAHGCTDVAIKDQKKKAVQIEQIPKFVGGNKNKADGRPASTAAHNVTHNKV